MILSYFVTDCRHCMCVCVCDLDVSVFGVAFFVIRDCALWLVVIVCIMHFEYDIIIIYVCCLLMCGVYCNVCLDLLRNVCCVSCCCCVCAFVFIVCVMCCVLSYVVSACCLSCALFGLCCCLCVLMCCVL